MKYELTKDLKCIRMRSGIEIWLEKDKINNLILLMEQKTDKGFVSVDGRFLNMADLDGIYKPEDIEELRHKNNRDWVDSKGNWQQQGYKECKCGNIIPYRGICGKCDGGGGIRR